MIGQTLSHYHVTAALGAGGMGEVYRATDTKLGRDVAIKILPAEVAKDPERLARFQREAHLLASLNHPHIAAIHGLEEADGQPFLVLELVQGEDLKARLERGAIPVDEALEIAKEIAEALEEAHGKGIIHRDLKPANVKVTPDGKVKVLDFGLAKAWAGDAADGSSPSASMSQSPTLAHSGTAAGVILGTAAYMSPEQARGKAVDKRSDVWAFGVLLWEMLTGQALFAGDTVTDVIAAVVTKEPDLDALPARTPAAVRRLIARCLRKDPRTRLPDIGGARLEIQDVLGGTAPEAEVPGRETTRAERRSMVRERSAWALALAAVGIAALFAFLYVTDVPDPGPVVRFEVEPPEGWSFMDFEWPVPSPDGRHVLIRVRRDEPEEGTPATQLWLRSLESLSARPLPGTGGARTPFWSPDNQFIGFFAEGEVRRLRIADGVVQTVCPLPTGLGIGGHWNHEGTIIFATQGRGRGLHTVAAAGGEPNRVMEVDVEGGETLLVTPQFLPDGRRFAFGALGGSLPSTYVGSLDRPDVRRPLVPGALRAQATRRHVVFNREGTLLAQPLDAERAELRGEPVAIASDLAFQPWANVGYFGVSPGGTLAYLSGGSEQRFQLTWLDRKGERTGTVGEPGLYRQIALSPDEKRVAVEIMGEQGVDLWVIDVARGVASRLTNDPAHEQDPVWSPDSQELVFTSSESGDQDVLRKGLRGGAPASPLPGGSGATPGRRDIPESWAYEGKTLVYVTKGETPTVWALSLEGDSEAELVLRSEYSLDEAQVSPDGRWLAYLSMESGDWEVYVEPFRKAGEKVRVSASGGLQLKWGGDGEELFYLAPDGQLMAVDVREGASGPEVGLPTALFELSSYGLALDHFDVSGDGQRFLAKVPVGDDPEFQMHVVLNWESLLETEE